MTLILIMVSKNSITLSYFLSILTYDGTPDPQKSNRSNATGGFLLDIYECIDYLFFLLFPELMAFEGANPRFSLNCLLK